MARVGAEVLDHHLGLLGDVVGVQAHEAGERLGGLLLLDLGVVLDRLDEAVVGLVGRVVGEHVEDEALLDGLAHGVEVEGDGLAVGAGPAEDLERLVLGRGGEGEEAEVLLLAAGGHRLDDLFLVVLEALVGGLTRRPARPRARRRARPSSSCALSPLCELCASSTMTA